MNAVGGEGPLGQIYPESEILTDVYVLLSRLADKSDRLITNSTTMDEHTGKVRWWQIF